MQNKKYLQKNYLIWFFYFLICFLLMASVLFIVKHIKLMSLAMNELFPRHLFLYLLIQVFIFLGTAFILKKKYKLKVFRISKKVKPKEVLYAFLGLMAVNAFSYFFVELLGIKVSQFENLNLENLRKEPYYFLLMIAVVAPFYEEYVFRGMMLRSLWPKRENGCKLKVLAVLSSSIMFTVFHEVGAYIPVFFLALYLSFLSLKTVSISLPIIVHSLQNFIAGIALLYDKELLNTGLFYFNIVSFFYVV
ncbi:MAG: CPBP family intramembrane metalloprotease [Spirochaetia bacterium]|nr:CPBP family intramembrane metalloprotease [Spirochaetia bacterium]